MKEQGEFSNQDSGTQMFSSTLLDLAQSLKQTGGDAELLRELCGVLVADVPRYLESAAAALHAADLVGVQRHVRSLRAACATVGASQVTAVAVLLEAHCRVDDICGARLKFAQLSELVSVLTADLMNGQVLIAERIPAVATIAWPARVNFHMWSQTMSSPDPKFETLVPRLAERQPTPTSTDDAPRTIHLLVDVLGSEGQHNLPLIFEQVESDDYLRNRCGDSLLDRRIDGLLH